MVAIYMEASIMDSHFQTIIQQFFISKIQTKIQMQNRREIVKK